MNPEIELCQWCDEPFTRDDYIDPLGLTHMHRECGARSILGSLAHIEKRCQCYVAGATETDPPGMTRREAAKAAFAAWNALGIQLPRE